MAYNFDQIFAADPANPANVARNAAITIFQPGDPTKTPLVITDPSGGALANPISVNANGFGSAFTHETLDRVAWDGGGFTGFFTSYEGMKNEAVAARTAAEAAATTAGAEAAVIATDAIQTATNEATAAAVSAANAQTAATTAATAATNAANLVGAPADTAIAAAINGTGTATKTALNATYATPSLVDTKVGNAIQSAGSQTPPTTALLPTQQKRTMIQTFQTGHGFSGTAGAGGSATTSVNDTTDSAIGTQAVKIVTSGTGTQSNVYRFNMPTPVDMTGKQFAILLKCDDPTHLKTLSLFAGNGGLTAAFTFTINNVAPADYIEAGKWMWVTIPWQQIPGGPSAPIGAPTRSSIAGMQINVNDDNTGNPVTIRIQAVASVPVPTQWGNGCLTFDFDDGFIAHYTIARKALAKYDYRADVYPVTESIDSGGTYMTTAQLQELQNSNGWLIGAHSDTWAHHNMPLANQSASELATFVASNRNWLATRGLRGYDFFAYPGGTYSGANLPIARQYYASARTVSSTLKETLPANDPHKLRVFNVGAGTTLAIAQAEVNAAIAGNYHLIMVFHDITGATTSIATPANFPTFVDWVATTTIPVKNMAEVLEAR